MSISERFQLPFIGVLEETDLERLPAPMLNAYRILRELVHCGMPFAHADGTLTVYAGIGSTYLRVDIDATGRMLFLKRGEETTV